MSNIGKFDTIEKQTTNTQIHPTWQRFVDYANRFSVEQREYASNSPQVKSDFENLQREYLLFNLFFDGGFNENDGSRRLCDSFIDNFVKAGNEYQSDLLGENEKLKREIAELKASSKEKKTGAK